MPGFLIIAHAPLASALRSAAQHTFPDCASALAALDVLPDMACDDIEAQARELLNSLDSAETLIFTDVFGATPCNAALRLAGQAAVGQIKVVAGVNVPMLWRSLCYADEPLDVVAARAVTGAIRGVFQVAASRQQNQAQNTTTHDQDPHHHQQ